MPIGWLSKFEQGPSRMSFFELNDEERYDFFGRVSVSSACFDERPSLITLVRVEHGRFVGQWSGVIPSVAKDSVFKLPNTLMQCNSYLNILTWEHPAVQPQAEPLSVDEHQRETITDRNFSAQISHALSDVVCFVCTSLENAAETLIEWIEYCHSISWRCPSEVSESGDRGHPPVACVMLPSDLVGTASYSSLLTRLFTLLHTSQATCRWSRAFINNVVFSGIRILPLDNWNHELPKEIVEAALFTRGERAAAWHLWPLHIFEKLQTKLGEQFKLVSRTPIEACKLLINSSHIALAERELWPAFVESYSKNQLSAAVELWGRTIAWQVTKYDHLFKPSEAYQSLYQEPCARVLKSSGIQNATSWLSRLERSIDSAVTEYISSPSGPNAAHFQSLKLSREIVDHMTGKLCPGCLLRARHVNLPCHHGLCEMCFWQLCKAQDPINQERKRYLLHRVLSCDKCPVCACDISRFHVLLTPPTAGRRTLCLDGGGVRGINILTVLEFLEAEVSSILRFDLPLRALFDLYVGTSTGGLIALGLARQRWPLDVAKQKFISLSKVVFPPGSGWFDRLGTWSRRMGNITSLAIGGSIYGSEGIQKALREAFGDGLLTSSVTETEDYCEAIRILRVAVTTVIKKCGIFTTYEKTGDGIESGYEWFQGKKHSIRPLRTFEAAACTSAAPAYLPAVDIGEVKFLDGGYGIHNCPVLIGLEESGAQPATVISVGCGIFNTVQLPPKSMWWRLAWNFGEIIDCENRFQDFKAVMKRSKSQVTRLNPRIDMDEVKLDDTSAMQNLQLKLEECLKSLDVEDSFRKALSSAAWQLVANLFYFELLEPPKLVSSKYRCKGLIACRYPKDSISKALKASLSDRTHFRIGSFTFRFRAHCHVEFEVKTMEQVFDISLESSVNGSKSLICGFPTSIDCINQIHEDHLRGTVRLDLRATKQERALCPKVSTVDLIRGGVLVKSKSTSTGKRKRKMDEDMVPFNPKKSHVEGDLRNADWARTIITRRISRRLLGPSKYDGGNLLPRSR